MRFNKETLLAVDLISRLTDIPTKVEDLAGAIGTSVPMLNNLNRKLRMAGLVAVKKGPNGGVSRNPSRTEITLYDVCAVTQAGTDSMIENVRASNIGLRVAAEKIVGTLKAAVIMQPVPEVAS